MLKQDKGAISNYDKQKDHFSNSISRQWDIIKLPLHEVNIMATKYTKTAI